MGILDFNEVLKVVRKFGFEKSFINAYSDPKRIIIRQDIDIIRSICKIDEDRIIFEKKLYLKDEDIVKLKRQIQISKRSGSIISDYPYSEKEGDKILVKAALPLQVNIAQIYRSYNMLNIEHNFEFFNVLKDLNEAKAIKVKENLNAMSLEIRRKFVRSFFKRNRVISQLTVETYD